MKPDAETIGSRLKLARTMKNLNIPQVYEKTGISKGNLSVIENDKTKPSADALIALSELYEVSVDWILKGEVEKQYKEIPSDIAPLFTGKEFKSLIKELEQEWEKGDAETKGWVVVQLRKAFPEIVERIGEREGWIKSTGDKFLAGAYFILAKWLDILKCFIVNFYKVIKERGRDVRL